MKTNNKYALIGSCDICGNITAIDLTWSLQHEKEMQSKDRTVTKVSKEEARAQAKNLAECNHKETIKNLRVELEKKLTPKLTPQKPQNPIQGITFFPIPKFDAINAALGADRSKYFNRHDIPKIPRVYQELAMALMFKRIELPKLSNKVDRTQAATAIQAWLVSFGPAHEAKMGTVAYALWVWSTLPENE
jgi:hypothetical protein